MLVVLYFKGVKIIFSSSSLSVLGDIYNGDEGSNIHNFFKDTGIFLKRKIFMNNLIFSVIKMEKMQFYM